MAKGCILGNDNSRFLRQGALELLLSAESFLDLIALF